mmetsp:Transcript_37845/g.98238  ORF Transcript_37845/g.98238 Transcript_37845/m.98238 type:complete len:300 (-) Transcript_37845:170-1069(-)
MLVVYAHSRPLVRLALEASRGRRKRGRAIRGCHVGPSWLALVRVVRARPRRLEVRGAVQRGSLVHLVVALGGCAEELVLGRWLSQAACSLGVHDGVRAGARADVVRLGRGLEGARHLGGKVAAALGELALAARSGARGAVVHVALRLHAQVPLGVVLPGARRLLRVEHLVLHRLGVAPAGRLVPVLHFHGVHAGVVVARACPVNAAPRAPLLRRGLHHQLPQRPLFVPVALVPGRHGGRCGRALVGHALRVGLSLVAVLVLNPGVPLLVGPRRWCVQARLVYIQAVHARCKRRRLYRAL